MDEFTEVESQAIGQMMRASNTLPDDFFGVPAVQELACLFVKIEPLLTDEQAATIIGCGAMLVHYSKDEMRAQVETMMAIGRAKSKL